MDTDFHKIYKLNERLNTDKAITTENNVWIGARSLILKGASIPDGTVVTASALLNKIFTQPNAIIAGSRAVIVNENIVWTL